MTDLTFLAKIPPNISTILIWVVPGLIITGIRSQFLTGRIASHSSTLLFYLTISFIYNTSAYTLTHLKSLDAWIWFAVIILIPGIIGFFFGLSSQKLWIYKFLRKVGFNPVHPIETAWDHVFKREYSQRVIVTLDDDSCIRGAYEKESFASSSPDERDLYLEKIYNSNGKDPWELVDGISVLIPSEKIRMIEFLPPPNQGEDHDDRATQVTPRIE